MSRDDAFTAFVAARGSALRRTAYLMTGDWHEAEDLTQTALAKLYLAWPRVTSEGAEAYARRIVARAFIDARRRLWRREQPTEQLPDRPGPVDRVEERLDLGHALARLSPSHRAVLVLRFWEDMSLEQVAGCAVPVHRDRQEPDLACPRSGAHPHGRGHSPRRDGVTMIDVELKSGLADLLVDEPSAGPDAARALRSGKRAQLRRRWSGAVGVAAGVVAVTAAVPFGASLLPSHPSGSVSQRVGRPGRRLPQRSCSVSSSRVRDRPGPSRGPRPVHGPRSSSPGATVTQGNLGHQQVTALHLVDLSRHPGGGYLVRLGPPRSGLRVPVHGVGCLLGGASLQRGDRGRPEAGREARRRPRRRCCTAATPEGELVTVASLAGTFGEGGVLTITSHDPGSDVPWLVSLEGAVTAALPALDDLGHFGAMTEASAPTPPGDRVRRQLGRQDRGSGRQGVGSPSGERPPPASSVPASSAPGR